MTPQDLVQTLTAEGFQLRVESETLWIEHEHSERELTETERAAVRQMKPDLLALLSAPVVAVTKERDSLSPSAACIGCRMRAREAEVHPWYCRQCFSDRIAHLEAGTFIASFSRGQ